MAPKVCVVTGCSSGVGLYCAVLFAKKGFITYATMRNPSKSEKLREVAQQHGVSEDLLKVAALDVADQASVDSFFDQILQTHGFVDILVNNAGFSVQGTIENLTVEDGKFQFETNVWGCVRTMKKVLPLMRQKRSGKVLTVTSVGGFNGTPFNDVYCASKFAMEGMIESMAPLYRSFNVSLVLIEPGAILTEFIDNAAKRPPSDPELVKYMDAVFSAFKPLFTPEFGQTGEQVGEIIVNTAMEDDPSLRVQTNQGPVYQAMYASKLVDRTGKAGLEATTKRFFGSLSS